MPKRFTILFFLLLSFSLIFIGCPAKESEEEKKAWPAQKTIYDQGFQDARSGKQADPEYQKNTYYTEGYSSGEQSVVVKDELI
jgi:hypothetical protein